MRSHTIPAQITTVEDKIAGNLNFTQIALLIAPVLFTTVVYGFFPPRMELSIYKFPLVLVVLFVCLILAMRVKGKVVLNWLAILLRYNIRPKYYLFNKNDTYSRELFMPVFEKRQRKLFKKSPAKQENKTPTPVFGIKEMIRLQTVMNDPRYNLNFRVGKKGGLNVFVGQEQK